MRLTQDAMERIYWEEKTEKFPANKRDQQDQQRGSGVKETLCGYEEPLDDSKFLRCSISDVVNQLKSEETMKQCHLDKKREIARRNREERECVKMKELEEKSTKSRKNACRYVVRTIDDLGGDDNDVQQSNTRTNSLKYEEKDAVTVQPCPHRPKDMPMTATKKTIHSNIDDIVCQASQALSNSQASS